MTVQTVPAYLQNASHSAAVFRQAVSAAFQSPGILGAGELAVSQQGTPNMSVILGAGRAMVAGSQVTPPSGLSFTTQAMYNTLNDGSITLTVTTANATNPRIDAVYIGVQDAFYSGSTNTAVAGIVAGTPSSSPVAPSIPANSLLLAYIAVGAGVTSIVTANITSKQPLAGGTAARIRFKGSILTGTSITINTPIIYSTIVEDTAAGWSATTGKYTVPAGGMYQLTVAAKQNTGAVAFSVGLYKNGAGIAFAGNAAAAAYTGCSVTHYEVCQAGDTLYAQGLSTNFTTQSDSPAHNNYLEIVNL